MPEVHDHEAELNGMPVFWRSASPAEGDNGASAAAAGSGAVPGDSGASQTSVPLYLHGVPDSSDEWLEFLARSGGLAPDLPGFGRSGKAGSLRFDIDEYADFIESFLELTGTERVRMVVHDWGGVGLAFAQRHPHRVERLVVINAVPFLPGYRWHRTARIWRTPLLGELAMGSTNARVLRLLSREGNATPGPMPEQWQKSVLEHFDQGTQRAILRLYRSSPPDVLAAAGARLGELRELGVPALVVWGQRDPYIAARFGKAYAEVLDAELVELPDAGHWPWLDRADAIDRVVQFVGAARE
ncbi:MAG TPA: alpha/beta hydrolase [Solirubrobacteraceae bacterium]|nr:alpha/beta hydrolase [Solirubrobacteraceae bacterium]